MTTETPTIRGILTTRDVLQNDIERDMTPLSPMKRVECRLYPANVAEYNWRYQEDCESYDKATIFLITEVTSTLEQLEAFPNLCTPSVLHHLQQLVEALETGTPVVIEDFDTAWSITHWLEESHWLYFHDDKPALLIEWYAIFEGLPPVPFGCNNQSVLDAGQTS